MEVDSEEEEYNDSAQYDDMTDDDGRSSSAKPLSKSSTLLTHCDC